MVTTNQEKETKQVNIRMDLEYFEKLNHILETHVSLEESNGIDVEVTKKEFFEVAIETHINGGIEYGEDFHFAKCKYCMNISSEGIDTKDLNGSASKDGIPIEVVLAMKKGDTLS